MSSVEETEAAIAGARTTGLPVAATLSFDTNGRTMMGITPFDLAGLHRRNHLAACGSNCGVGPSELVASIVNLASASDPAAILVAKANCGIPQFVDGAIRFNGTPELMARIRLPGAWMPVRGSSAVAAAPLPNTCASCVARSNPMCAGPVPDLATIEARLGSISSGATAQLRGEMDRQAGAAAGATGRRSTGRRGART